MINEYDIDNKHYEKIFNRLVNELAEKDDYITRLVNELAEKR